MSKKDALRKLEASIDKKGNSVLRDVESGRITYNVNERASYSVGGVKVSAKKNNKSNVAAKVFMEQAIENVRRRIAFDEQENQTFAKIVRMRLEEDGRVSRGNLSRSLFSTVRTQVNTVEAGDLARNLPQPTQTVGGITQQQADYAKGKLRKRQNLYAKLRTSFPKSKGKFQLGIEVDLRALEYYRMLDLGFSPEEAERYLPKSASEYDKLRDWVRKKINPSGNVNTLYLIANRIQEKWREVGYEGKQYTDRGIEEYRLYVNSLIRKEFFRLYANSGMIKNLADAEAGAIATELLDYNGLFLARVVHSRQAVGNAFVWSMKQKAAFIGRVTKDQDQEKKLVKLELNKIKEDLERAKKVISLIEDEDDEYLGVIGERPEDDFSFYEGYDD